MTITYVGGKSEAILGTTSTTNISLTDLTGGIASSPSSGDLIIVVYAASTIGNQGIGVNTTGYTELAYLFADDSRDTNFSVNTKFSSGGDTAVEVSGLGSTSYAGAVLIQVWRNVNESPSFDVAIQTATGVDSGIPNPPAITPITSGSIVCVFGAGAGSSSMGSGSFSSSELSNFASVTTNDSLDVILAGGSFAWTSGTFDPAIFVLSGTSDSTVWSNASATLALRPSGGGGGGPSPGVLLAENGSFLTLENGNSINNE